MSAMYVLSFAAPFIAIALTTYTLSQSLGRRWAVRKRVSKPKAPGPAVLRQEQQGNPMKERLLSWLSSSGKWAMKNGGEVSKIRSLLIQAGYRQDNAPAVFYGLKAALGLALPVPVILYAVVQDKFALPMLLLAFLVAGAGYFLPQYLLMKKVQFRQERIDKALPDVIDLFIICMESGLALQATINRVADEIEPVCRDLHYELQVTSGEMRTGISRDQALRNLAERTGVKSMRALITLIIQSDKLGTSIAQALRVHADFIRVQRTQRAEEKAAKLPVKILIPLLFCIFPAMFIVVIGPGIIKIARNLLPALSGH